VAVGESGRQARLLTEGVGVDAATKQKKSSVLEFATGRLPDNVDRPTNKAAVQKSRVVVIAGPTAVGESRVAIALANELGGEIISADSIQVGLLAAPLIPFSASETSSAANALKEELALARSQLKEAEDEAAEAATAHESLAIVKEEWEAEKTGLQSDVLSLENEKSNLEVEKEAEVVTLEEDSKNLSCMNTAKEEEELAAHQAELGVLRSELQQISRTSAVKEEELSENRKEIGVLQTELQTKQALLQEVEAKLLETVKASKQLIKEKLVDTNVVGDSFVGGFLSSWCWARIFQSASEQEIMQPVFLLMFS
jgi:hypothetical protein